MMLQELSKAIANFPFDGYPIFNGALVGVVVCIAIWLYTSFSGPKR